ncbi:nucleotidyltransferase family protein [Neobacillus niacini]|uniref:nucleotidyltransferase domain-containing protein n=1 Tax=Neobacillus niacini TaxID=86668 RepID=UPI0028664466|nr:nucleotidyltransferase family protein [Neobacillus niacini]MDR7000592.1 hypothetical protein [Neobacillus niacini]
MWTNFKLDLSSFSKELNLLIKLIKLDDHVGPEIIDKEVFSEINWEQFIELAKHHRVYPIIYLNLKKVANNCVPLNVLQEFSQLYRNNTIRMLHLSGEMEQISKLFAENKVRTLFLKGPVLATALYGDVSLRTSSDIDLLIPIKMLKKVEKLIVEQGYIKDDYIESVLNDWKWRHHHITFFHPGKKIKLEIHWRMNPGPAKEPQFDELWKKKRKSLQNSYPIYYLGCEDLFLFLVTHGARHGWSRLRWLVDIDKLIQQSLNYKEIIKLLRKYQYPHIGGQSLILTSQIFNSKVNEELLPLINDKLATRLAQEALFYISNIVNLHTEPLPQKVAEYHKRHLFLLRSNRQKLLFLMSFLYPFATDTETLPLPKVLHILYFPLRPILMLWRRTRSRAVTRRV